jgi:large subunit ribosomal protein L15e
MVKVQHPTRPEKARRLGYKAKQGYAVFRIRIRRGGRKRPVARGKAYGKPKTAGVNHLKNDRSLQTVAEQRCGKTLGALRVLNSYWVNQDAVFKWFEVILVDPMSRSVRTDPGMNWIVGGAHKHRECRGKTSAGRKGRGLRQKGHKATKNRPSRAAWRKRIMTNKMWRYR